MEEKFCNDTQYISSKLKMNSYIALLRGINVSGQKLIKMADLRKHLAELPFESIQTYIQSGNIVFQSEIDSKSELENLIHNKIKEKYGFEVPTLVKAPNDFIKALEKNPFKAEESEDPKRLYLTFLSKPPDKDKMTALRDFDYSPEKYVIDGDLVFFFSPHGYGKAKMNNNFFEQKLKVSATTRNWKTVHILLEMGSKTS